VATWWQSLRSDRLHPGLFESLSIWYGEIIVFDKYADVSAKAHEGMLRTGEVIIDYELSITSPLPKRDAILKSKKNDKRNLASVLCTCDEGQDVTMDTSQDGVYGHDEADITMVSYIFVASNSGQRIVCVLSNDTDVFLLLVYWVYRAEL
jgi:hypothetical protein